MVELRSAEPWETSAAGAYATVLGTEHAVSIWALGEGRHLVVADGQEEVVAGHDAAHRLAHELAATRLSDR